MIKTPQTSDGPIAEGIRKINIVLSWFEELKELGSGSVKVETSELAFLTALILKSR